MIGKRKRLLLICMGKHTSSKEHVWYGEEKADSACHSNLIPLAGKIIVVRVVMERNVMRDSQVEGIKLVFIVGREITLI